MDTKTNGVVEELPRTIAGEDRLAYLLAKARAELWLERKRRYEELHAACLREAQRVEEIGQWVTQVATEKSMECNAKADAIEREYQLGKYAPVETSYNIHTGVIDRHPSKKKSSA